MKHYLAFETTDEIHKMLIELAEKECRTIDEQINHLIKQEYENIAGA